MRIKLLPVSDYSSSMSFEFLPGKFQNKCGNKESRFLDEMVFCFFEGIIAKRFAEYDHYNFQYLDGPTILAIASDLRKFAKTLRSTADPEAIFKGRADSAKAFKPESLMEQIRKEGLPVAAREFAVLAEELADWFEKADSTHGGMSILGL